MYPPNDEYQIRAFHSSNINCPLESVEMEIEDLSSSEDDKPDLKPVLTSTYPGIKVKMPEYETLTQMISFKLKATAKGGLTASTDQIKIKLKNCDN